MTEESENQREQQNSIKVSKTSTGKYNFEVKIYFKEANESKSTIDKIKEIYDKLEDQFKVQ